MLELHGDEFDLDSNTSQQNEPGPGAAPHTDNEIPIAPETQESRETSQGHIDALDTVSRAATWGTRRRSDPGIDGLEVLAEGSFLKKLSLSKTTRDKGQNQLKLLADLVYKRNRNP